MKTFKRGDTVRYISDYDGPALTGTVVRVGRWKHQVLFPINKKCWIKSDCLEKISKSKGGI